MDGSKGDIKTVNGRLNSTTAGLTFSAAAFCYLLLSLVFAAATKPISGTDAEKYLNFCIAPLSFIITNAVVLKIRNTPVRAVCPVKCGVKYYFIALLMIFGLTFFVSGINPLFIKLLQTMGYVPREESSYIPDLSGGRIVLAVFVIALLPAIFEEFTFRGVIFCNLRASAGDIRAIFLTGFCFALFHASPEQTIYQFICGCAFSLLCSRSGSVLPGVLMHFLNNALILVLRSVGAADLNGNFSVPPAVDITLTVLGALAFTGALVWLILDKKPWQKGVKGGVKNFFICAAAGIAAFAVIWIFSLFAR